jgi:anion-transporting  ArsA/GET3 family ATPase
VPAKSRVFTMASKPFYRVADRILGSQFLEDIAQFFLLFQTMYDGFVERSRAVTRTLADKRTTFVVVSTLEPAPVREAEFFVDALAERRFHLGAIVLNKVLPEWFMARGTTGVAKRLASRSDALAAALPAELAEAARLEAGVEPAEPAVAEGDLNETKQVARVLAEVGESFLNFQLVAKREAEQRAELASRADVLAAVPYADHDITDLSGLLELGDELWRER